MSGNRYPWVPREYYPAVMFACKMIRENGFFNKAIETAADYYGIDPGKLERHVRARQAAGQRGKKRGPMKWFVAGRYFGSDGSGFSLEEAEVVRGLTLDSVERRFSEDDMAFCKANDCGSSYSLARYHVIHGPFDTKAEAEEYAREWGKEWR